MGAGDSMKTILLLYCNFSICYACIRLLTYLVNAGSIEQN